MDGRQTEDDEGPIRFRCEEGEERCDVCERDDVMTMESERQQIAQHSEDPTRQEPARQERWMDSGIDVFSSSVPIPNMEIPSSSFPRVVHYPIYTLREMMTGVVWGRVPQTVIRQVDRPVLTTDLESMP